MSEFDKVANQAQRDLEKSQQDILENLKVKYHEDGSADFYGIPLPRVLGHTVNWATTTFSKDIISSLSDWAYKGASKVTQQITKDSAKAAKVGTIAKYGTFIALVSGPVLSAFGHAFKVRWNDRSELYDEFRPVMQATGVNVKTNGVMELEFYRANNRFVANSWNAFKKLPTAIVKAVVAGQGLKQKDLERDIAAEVNAQLNTMNFDELKEKYKDKIDFSRLGSDLNISKKLNLAKEALSEILVSDGVASASALQKGKFSKWISRDNHDKYVMGGVASLEQGLEVVAKDNEKKVAKRRDPSPWEMIQALRVYMDDLIGPTRDACAFDNVASRDISIIKNKVKDIFQRYEHDMDVMRRETGKPNLHYGEITGAGNLKALNDVSQIIAEAIADGTIDARALVDLVGDGKVISHSKDKRTINVDAAVSQIAELRDKLGTCAAPDPKEFFAHFDSPDVIKDSLKKHLNEMQGVERACLASLFSDNILKAVGMKQEEITAARKEAHSHMYKLVADNIRDLASKSEEELTKLQIKEEDIETLLQLSHRIDRGDKKAIKSLVDGRGRILLQNILGVAALQELETDKGAWVNRVNGRSSHQEKDKARHRSDEHDSAEEPMPDYYGDENRAADEKRAKLGHGHKPGHERDAPDHSRAAHTRNGRNAPHHSDEPDLHQEEIDVADMMRAGLHGEQEEPHGQEEDKKKRWVDHAQKSKHPGRHHRDQQDHGKGYVSRSAHNPHEESRTPR